MLKIATLYIILLTIPSISYTEEIWTLENSVQQAISVSPLVFAAKEEINSRKAALSQAGAWPNPTLEIGGSNKLGIDDGKGGHELTNISISQPIPLGRLSVQRKKANADLKSANYNHFYQQLLQENIAAYRFHELQLAKANFNLAKEQLKFVNYYQKNKENIDSLVRYLNNLDRKRLDIMREISEQNVASAEGEYSEALSNFRALLNLSQDSSSTTTQLKVADLSETLINLLNVQNENHPAIATAKYKKKAADAQISIERNKRFPDLKIKLYREKDLLGGRRQEFNGVMVDLTFPLWNFNNGGISKAIADTYKTGYELDALRRNFQAELRQTYLHLKHVIKQAEHHRTRILSPAKEIFILTQKSFATGEVTILSLIDANNTYFEARKRYLDLLYESWTETANLRLAAGLSLLNIQE